MPTSVQLAECATSKSTGSTSSVAPMKKYAGAEKSGNCASRQSATCFTSAKYSNGATSDEPY